MRKDGTPLNIAAGLAVVCGLLAGSARAGERVALRCSNGRFLRATEQGTLRADRLFPTEPETFELLGLGGDYVALEAFDGRFLVAEGRDARHLRADSPRVEPGDRETFELILLGQNRAAMKARGFRDVVIFHPAKADAAPRANGSRPSDEETVEVYRAGEIPPAIRVALAVAIRKLADDELAEKQYDRVRTRKEEKYIELPAPTLRNLRRKKKVRVLSVTHQYHLKAQLDGTLEIQIAQMPYLRGFFEAETGVLMFAVRATAPVRGRVRYKIPDALSASTGFRTVVQLDAVGEVRVGKSGDQISLSSPELLELNVKLRSLDLSNDVLHVVRREIEDLVNDELRDRRDRIRRQANQSIRKAVESQEFRLPLLRYLTFL